MGPSHAEDGLSIPAILPDLTKTAFRKVIEDTRKEIRSEHDHEVRVRLRRARRLNEQTLISKQNGSASSAIAASRGSARPPIKHDKSPFEGMDAIKPDLASIPLRYTIKIGQRFTKLHKEITTTNAYSYTSYKDTSLKVPPYTNYISTKHNILVEDDKHRTSIPYLGDDALIDQDYMQVEQKLTRNAEYYERLNAFAERANQFLPYADELLSKLGTSVDSVLDFLLNGRPHSGSTDALRSLTHSVVDHLEYGYYSQSDDSDTLRHKKRNPKRAQAQWRKARSKISKTLAQDSIDRAALACNEFYNVTGISLWHVAKHAAEAAAEGQTPMQVMQVAKKQSFSDAYQLGTYAALGCLVCKAHECPGHGEFEDKDDEKNLRHRVNHCEYYRSDSGQMKPLNPLLAKTFYDAIGLDDDEGVVTGAIWSQVVATEAHDVFGDTELCSKDCFWSKNNRSRLGAKEPSAWYDNDARTLETLRPAYDDYRRGPCMLHATGLLSSKSCFEIFRHMFTNPTTAKNTTSFRPSNNSSSAVSRGKQAAARRDLDHWLAFDNSWKHHEREPFIPCNHSGPCNEKTDCDCYRLDITCEKFCACTDTCRRKFKGCLCAARGKACYNDDRCECHRLNRECDPDLCRSCGAHQALDPVNRYNSDTLSQRCANVSVQRGVPKRTLLGHSKMMAEGGRSGWGLYMGEPCRKDEYIGEYVGEVVTTSEAEQRGIIYDKRNMSYLFDVNRLQTLDSTLVGNKLRFINHQPNPIANVKPRTMFCNTVQRMGMYATRDIAVGEELFFDYGTDFASKVELIVQGQTQTTVQAAQVALHSNRGSRAGSAASERAWAGGIASLAPSSAKSSAAAPVTNSTSDLPIKVGRGSSKPVNLSKNGRRVGRPPKFQWVDSETFRVLQQGSKKREGRKRSHALMLDGAVDEIDGTHPQDPSSVSGLHSQSQDKTEVVISDSEDEAVGKGMEPIVVSDDSGNEDASESSSEDDKDDGESVFDSDDAKQRRKRRKRTRKRRSDAGVRKGPRLKKDVIQGAVMYGQLPKGQLAKRAARKTGGSWYGGLD